MSGGSAATPRAGDVGSQSAWIIGAVCPARDTGVALVLTRLDTEAMNRVDGQGGLMDKAG
ncbi:MAG: hypothetical protein WB611_05510 [Stellaceae bacterium]